VVLKTCLTGLLLHFYNDLLSVSDCSCTTFGDWMSRAADAAVRAAAAGGGTDARDAVGDGVRTARNAQSSHAPSGEFSDLGFEMFGSRARVSWRTYEAWAVMVLGWVCGGVWGGVCGVGEGLLLLGVWGADRVLQGSPPRHDTCEDEDVVAGGSDEAVRLDYSCGSSPVRTHYGDLRSRLDGIESEVAIRTHHAHALERGAFSTDEGFWGPAAHIITGRDEDTHQNRILHQDNSCTRACASLHTHETQWTTTLQFDMAGRRWAPSGGSLMPS
jgi:hypothetical protein